jgi:hypothetical protein
VDVTSESQGSSKTATEGRILNVPYDCSSKW